MMEICITQEDKGTDLQGVHNKRNLPYYYFYEVHSMISFLVDTRIDHEIGGLLQAILRNDIILIK